MYMLWWKMLNKLTRSGELSISQMLFQYSTLQPCTVLACWTNPNDFGHLWPFHKHHPRQACQSPIHLFSVINNPTALLLTQQLIKVPKLGQELFYGHSFDEAFSYFKTQDAVNFKEATHSGMEWERHCKLSHFDSSYMFNYIKVNLCYLWTYFCFNNFLAGGSKGSKGSHFTLKVYMLGHNTKWSHL